MTMEGGSHGSALRHLASVLLLIALAAELGAVALNLLMADQADPTLLSILPFAIVIVSAYAIVGWLIASRRPDNSIGWIFLAIALSLATGVVFANTYVRYGSVVAPGSLPFLDVLAWVSHWAWAPGFTLLVTLSVLLFPNGKPPSPRWRPVIWATFLVMGLLSIPVAIATWTGRGSDIADSLQTLGSVLILFVALCTVVATASPDSVAATPPNSTVRICCTCSSAFGAVHSSTHWAIRSSTPSAAWSIASPPARSGGAPCPWRWKVGSSPARAHSW